MIPTLPQNQVRAWTLSIAFGFVVTLLHGGCDDDHGNPVPDDGRRNVMVIDDGIDPALPMFQGKVAALYTIDCQAPASPAPDDVQGAQSYQQAKAQLLAELATTDESCHLRDGIDPKPAAFPQLSDAQRNQWNDALLHDRSILEPPVDATYTALEALPFPAATGVHGTATSGVIAYDDSQLRMVLVEEALGDPGAMSGNYQCLDPASIALAIALYSDPDVRAAYLQRPLASVDRELGAARAAHGVRLVNESFGPLARFTIDRAQKLSGCPEVPLGDYFVARGQLLRDYDDAHAEPDVLFVRAAGNDGASLNGPEDHLYCRMNSPHQLLVGSYGLDGVKSSFTNFGPCVDVFAPGELIVGPLPGDLLFPLDGTSFSAPLALRLMLSLSPAPFAPATARDALLALRGPDRRVPIGSFPAALIYDPNHLSTASGLTAAAPVPVDAARASTPISARALALTLGPIRWAQRHPVR